MSELPSCYYAARGLIFLLTLLTNKTMKKVKCDSQLQLLKVMWEKT